MPARLTFARLLALGLAASLGAVLSGAVVAEAQEMPTAVRRADPEAAARLEREAEEAFAADDLETAIGRYRDAVLLVDSDAEKVRMLMLVAWLEHLRQRDDAAVRALTDVLVIAPEHPFRAELYSDPFRDLFLDAQERAAEERTDRALEQVHLARRSLDAGDRDAARRQLESALELEPTHLHALYNLALLELLAANDDRALELFQKIVALAASGPGTVPADLEAGALTNLGALFQRRDLHREAEEALLRAVEIEPGNGVAWTNLGVARRRLGRSAEAAEAFRRAYRLSPDDPTAATNLAVSYLDAGDAAAAASHLREATARFPEEPRLWLDLGRALVAIGDPAGAAEAFEQALRHDPADAAGQASRAAIQLARLAYGRGDYAATVQQAGRALALRPGSADGQVYLGLGRKAQGDLAGARAAFEEAVRLAPERPDSHNNLGSVYYELGLYDLAEASFRRALDIAPDLGDARRNLEAVAAARASGVSARPFATTGGTGATTAPATTAPPPPAAPRGAAPAPAPRLGLRFADIDYAALGLAGVMVDAVEPGSPADRAGLRRGDLILQVDGHAVTGGDDLLRRVAEARGQATLDLLRDNRPQRLILPLP